MLLNYNTKMKDSYYYSKEETNQLPKTDFKTNRKIQKNITNLSSNSINFMTNQSPNKISFSPNKISFSPNKISFSPNKINFNGLYQQITSKDFSNNKYRSPFKNYGFEDYNRIKSQIKKSLEIAKENISLNESRNILLELEEYQLMNQQHRYEVDKLLLQIQRLHQTIQTIERQKKNQIQKLKQEYEQISFLNMSSVKQNHTAQVDMLQTQIRKSKQFYTQKCCQYDNLVKKYERQTGYLSKQNKKLSQQIKEMIKNKNNQIFQIQKKCEMKVQDLREQHSSKINQMNQAWQKQIQSLQKQISQKQDQQQKLKFKSSELNQQNQKLFISLQNQKSKLGQQLAVKLQTEKLKYNQLKNQFTNILEQQRKFMERNYQIKQDLLQEEIQRLKSIIDNKNRQIKNIQSVLESVQEKWNSQLSVVVQQNKMIRQQIVKNKNQFLKQTQILKVKLTALHQNDIKQLVKFYQLKLKNVLQNIKEKDDQINILRKNLYEQTSKRYQNKKKFQVVVSQLNAKVIKLRSGLNILQTDLKEKLQNQKSMMLLTSRSLIKDVQAKATSNKFYQEQLRKLRQLFDLQERQIYETNFQVQQKIKIAEEQLQRLSKKVLQQKKSNQQIQNEYKKIISIKEEQINKLQTQLRSIQYPEFDNSKELKKIQDLGQQLSIKNQQIGKLKDTIDLLQKKLSQMKSEIEQYQMEHQISHAQAKEQYNKISQRNMSQFKIFYESRIADLQKDKADLKELISSKEQKFSELIVKYRQLQDAIQEVLNQAKKKTELQKKVIQIGMDTNLIKNMSQIMRSQSVYHLKEVNNAELINQDQI